MGSRESLQGAHEAREGVLSHPFSPAWGQIFDADSDGFYSILSLFRSRSLARATATTATTATTAATAAAAIKNDSS